ncbi:hypothetical protein A5893_00555 [Pedobacter psychrophilus]|uniref:Uncharacterized protein n=1 Tax=Pedobacter psychrophilus TaxID=1826909 RepID=A0A179DKQ0_9SPHI|nr:hypothetical protein [Pedobacter psychrophilus]OAQ41635.1 hypothetical protein A5893_00555 [Pedobacter psychrophilus]
MDTQHQYTVEEVLEIALKLNDDDRKLIKEEIQKSLLNKEEILNKINPIHKKYESTYKALS